MNDVREAPTTSRRALLAAGVAGLAAITVGCDADSGNPGAGATTPPVQDSPDQPLVDAAAVTLQGLAARAAYTRRHLPQADLRRLRLDAWVALHRAQLRRVRADATSTVGALRTRTPWATMRKQEVAAAGSFATQSLRAESGALAGLLVQLAAGIDMQLAATDAPRSLAVEPEAPLAVPTIQVEAMQKTLADEHAALFLYGVLGAHTSASRSPALYAAVDAAYVAHRARRDRITALLDEAGEDPVASEPGYEIPSPLRTVQQVADEGLRLERAAAARYLWLVENSTDDVRALGVAALRNTAARELSFRGSPEIFPGAF